MLPCNVHVFNTDKLNFGKYGDKVYTFYEIVRIFHDFDNKINNVFGKSCAEKIELNVEEKNFYKWLIKNCFPSVSALKAMRKKRKLKQEELAALSGVNVRSIRAYEQGKNDISKAQGDTLQMLAKAQGETLLMLAKALNCTVEELLN